MRWVLNDALTNGSQVGPTLCLNDLGIDSGRFSNKPDFGAAFTESRFFIEVSIRGTRAWPSTTMKG